MMFTYSIDINISKNCKNKFEKIISKYPSFEYDDDLYDDDDDYIYIHIRNVYANPSLKNESEKVQNKYSAKKFIELISELNSLND